MVAQTMRLTEEVKKCQFQGMFRARPMESNVILRREARERRVKVEGVKEGFWFLIRAAGHVV